MIKGMAVKVLGSKERFREEGQKRLKKGKRQQENKGEKSEMIRLPATTCVRG